jgi:hypothetical protein
MSAVTIVHHAVWTEKIDRVQAVHKDEQLLLRRNSVACLLELSATYFQSASSVFLSHKSANSTFSSLFSTQGIVNILFSAFFHVWFPLEI